MEDYPRTLAEFERRFAAQEACRAYLVQLRRPSGFRCPKCGGTKSWPVGALFQCAACGLWWVTSEKTGASAVGLQQALRLGSYETAWTWLRRPGRAYE